MRCAISVPALWPDRGGRYADGAGQGSLHAGIRLALDRGERAQLDVHAAGKLGEGQTARPDLILDPLPAG